MGVTVTNPAHPHRRLSIFDDQQGRFGPLTDRRPCFDLRTGAVTNRQRIEQCVGGPAAALFVADRLAAVMREREPAAAINAPLEPGQWLMVNGRLSGDEALSAAAAAAADPDVTAAMDEQGRVLWASLPHDAAAAFVDAGFDWSRVRDRVRGAVKVIPADRRLLIERPWHILDELEAVLARDMDRLVEPRIAASAKVHPAAVLDDSAGPIVIEGSAVVGPLVVLEGPCVIGECSVVQPHAYIRPHSVIGRDCKVAGEVSFSIIEDHTNKAHYGYLGHALVGQWVNLGAGTTVSNLKNTYGQVRVQLTPTLGVDESDAPAPAPESTGRTNHGPIIGDFVRTAIGTMIPTGACIGTACMIAVAGGYAPKFAPAAGFHTDRGRQPHEPDCLIATARAMLGRRKVRLAPAEEALLRAIAGPASR